MPWFLRQSAMCTMNRAELEMRAQLPEARQDQKFSATALEVALLEFPGGRVWNKNGAQTCMERGIDVASRAVAYHPTVCFYDFELLDNSLVRASILFEHDFDRIEIGLKARALHFASLLG